jgi:hypothetical protein
LRERGASCTRHGIKYRNWILISSKHTRGSRLCRFDTAGARARIWARSRLGGRAGRALSPKVKEFVYIAGGGNADKGAKGVDYMGVASPPLSRRAGWVLGVEDSEARLCGLLARRLRIAITNEFQCICLPPLFRRTIRRMLFAVKNTPPGR